MSFFWFIKLVFDEVEYIYCKGTTNIHFLIDYKAVIYSSFIYGIMTHIDQK